MQFLLGITVQCFVFSYLVAFLLELTRPLVRIPGRLPLTVLFTVAGLVAQIIYIVLHAQRQIRLADGGLLAGWYEWSLMLAWGLAACYLFLLVRRPDTVVGYFLLPPVLALIAVARTQADREPFTSRDAANLWLGIHGAAMLVGTLAVILGLTAALMYLVHSARLKRKRLNRGALRLPPLDWLQGLNRKCLVTGTVALGVGLLAGVIANLNRGQVAWTGGGVLLSGVLLVWLLAATAFEFFYRPARQGRKIAYLAVASFGFLLLAWLGVLFSPHGGSGTADPEVNMSKLGVFVARAVGDRELGKGVSLVRICEGLGGGNSARPGGAAGEEHTL